MAKWDTFTKQKQDGIIRSWKSEINKFKDYKAITDAVLDTKP